MHLQTFAVESKKAATFTVNFHPLEVGMYNHELHLRVKQNPFEQYKLAISGECYQEDLMFTGLPDDSLTVLALPDALILPVPVTAPGSSRPQSRLSQQDIALPGGSTITAAAAAAAAAAAQLVPTGVSSYTFALVNESHNKHFRFKWAEHPQLKFSPSVGHIHAGRSKNITVTFTASTPTKLDGQEIKLAISQISYKVNWGNQMSDAQGPEPC
eukprot:GHUV01050217.1.p1 GENE.GHUV01050217.1~~GHUV01050217.1.p1  ORF type:complete len:213 (+),score=80.54 GHUV01050217.1:425-1063(+)